MGNGRMEESSEEEALFQIQSYPYAALYFVQSPSNLSHAYSLNPASSAGSATASPLPSGIHNLSIHNITNHLNYPSSRASSTSQKTNTLPTPRSRGGSVLLKNDGGGDHDHGSEEEMGGGDGLFIHGEEASEKGWHSWQKYLSMSYSDSWWWIWMQLGWRFFVSLLVGLTVFYIAAKPPLPGVSVQISGIREFKLGEGVDSSGVSTKILSSNITIEFGVENESKLFGLHIHPPIVTTFFRHFPFAITQGSEMYAGMSDFSVFHINSVTRNKAMYGAGRSMQDMLDSGNPLQVTVKLSFKSTFHVIWGIFEPKFHYESLCQLHILNSYDVKHRTQNYNSTCLVI